jgi:Domain of unknown function (DUF5671)
MQTIRRLYLYAVTIVSVEVVTWGAIGLLRSILAGEEIGGSVSRLAGALSLILVGVPVFLIHWLMAQRNALNDPDERSNRLRAIFLYGVLLVTLIPAVQNALSLLDRIILQALGQPSYRAMLGGSQSLSDNLVAIVVNLGVAAYFFWVLRADWRAYPMGDDFPETRRLYRYIWLVYGLVMVVLGSQQALAYLLVFWTAIGAGSQVMLANGLTLLVIGTPIWAYAWLVIQRSLVEPAEAESLIRLVVLYALVFVGLGALLLSAGMVLYWVLRILLGETLPLGSFVVEVYMPLSIAISTGLAWAYYGRILRGEMNAMPDAPRRGGLRRLYYYVLALAGLGGTFIGLQMLLTFLLDMALNKNVVWAGELRNNLAAALAILAVSLPLWIFAWRPMAAEAALEGEAGDHARRSVMRKGYLYLVLFAGVLGVMFSTGALLYQLLSAILGQAAEDLLFQVLQYLKLIVLFALLLAYHWHALRADNRLAARSLARRHALFPVLVLAPDDSDFVGSLVSTLEREVKELPVAVHPYSQGAPDETLSAARAVILPAELLTKPSEALRLWLLGFEGPRLVVPAAVQGWHWLYGGGRSTEALARQTARAMRKLAEGEAAPQPGDTPGWMFLVYVLAGLFALELVWGVLALLISVLLRGLAIP